jgi:ABC-type dipeptide/oligopeptide/nickel transport system permease subunit
MSDPQNPPRNPQIAGQARHPVVTALMVIAGIILLLPGLCTLIFVATLVYEQPLGIFNEPGLLMLWIILIAIGWGGFVLIRRGVRGRAPPTL